MKQRCKFVESLLTTSILSISFSYFNTLKMRVLCVLVVSLIFIITILTVSAQERRAATRRSGKGHTTNKGIRGVKATVRGKITTFERGTEGVFLIKYKEGVSLKGKAKPLRGKKGRKLRKLKKLGTITATKVSEKELQRLAEDDDVELIEQSRPVTLAGSCTTYSHVSSWGVDRIDQLSRDYDGQLSTYTAKDDQQVFVYVVDTGIHVNHPFFQGRAEVPFSTIEDDPTGYDYTDYDGHGTRVASTIGGSRVGIARKATLIGVKVADVNFAFLVDVGDGLEWILNNHTARRVADSNAKSIINFSMGLEDSSILDRMMTQIMEAGIPVVTSAGNDGESASLYSPGRVPNIINVGATDIHDELADFSNDGPAVDIFAPGVDIVSAKIGDPTRFNSGHETWNGTSVSTAHVTGVIASYLHSLSGPQPSPAAIASWLKSKALKGQVIIPNDRDPATTTDLLHIDC